ncbi:hypothetical protein NQ317_002715 [Molorchus minor]|uniref:Fanconi anemia group D2 protein n=1 Tax=Molorchus minor TaxID=1323400 RepID=A0ABQ9K5R5_9CUCU|nr:hypothetical protein NQ317_002715 [Molorchus minor]
MSDSERSSPILTSHTQDHRSTLTVFKSILADAGISLSFTEGPHILTQEQALVVRDLEKSLGKSPENVQEFMKGLMLLCKKVKNLRKCVLPTKFRRNGELSDEAISIQQDSLFRIFLKTNYLQKEIMLTLLEEIAGTSSEELRDTSWLRLLLNPLRYLPHISEPATLTTKLLDILDIANFPSQLEIIDSIPEIIPDSQYNETAQQLSRLLDENDELTGVIIDCLNALDLDSEIRSQVQDRILAKILAGPSLKIFPVLLQFLLTDCKSQNLVPTLIKVRNALDTIMVNTEKNKEKESCKILIFNRLQAFAVSPKHVAEAWLNTISSIKVHSDHRPVDLLILFMLHATVRFKKRKLFEILCKLSCGEQDDESMSGFKDEIHMVVRKQLSSSKRNIKHRGIIAAVVMAKHIALRCEEQKDIELPDGHLTISDLPYGPAREAASLLELTGTCTGGSSEFTGLYYDQVAMMLSETSHLDKYFLAWLHETIIAEFENTYITETVPNNINDLKFSMQYVLNTPSESAESMAVNIAGLTLQNESGLILLLAPHFRLLRLAHYRLQAGDVSMIKTLLGCAVILPDVDDALDLDTDQARQVADCLFHCVNWFREIINGFVTQKVRATRSKVLKRVQDVIDVEKKLRKIMENIPEHKLPISYFDSSDVNKQQMSPMKRTQSKEPKEKIQISCYDSFNSDDSEQLSIQTQSATLNIEQLQFILKDYATKLSVLTKGQNIGLSHLIIVSPITAMSDLEKILPLIDAHFKIVIKKINKLLETTDGRYDLPDMFTPEVSELKACFGLVLDIYYHIFSWTGFQHSRNLDLLKNYLRGLRLSQTQSLNSANRLIVEFIGRLAGYHQQCLELPHAVSLIRIIECLYSIISQSQEIDKKITAVAEKLLNRRWYNSKGDLESGKNCNANIDILIKVYLKGADVKTISGLVGTLQDQVSNLNTKEDCLHMLGSINKQNFHIFYTGLCTALLNRVKTELQSLTNREHLELWNDTAKIMQALQAIAKARESKVNLFTKDSSLMAHVPKFRLTLETLVYKVKAMLVANNCSAAFWMGNLRNKDLDGEDILSQSTTVTEENQNSDEELPADDSDDDAVVIEENASNDGTGSRGSEVFD